MARAAAESLPARMIFVNGAPSTAVSAMDRGLAYGDGVFRTLLARSGAPLHWERQYAKLAHDCAALRLRMPEARLLEAEVRAACRGVSECAVKIVVTRGAGARGYRYDPDAEPTRIVYAEARTLVADANREHGVRIRLCTTRLGRQPALAGIKHLNRLENVLARAEWTDPEITEGVMCDDEGNIIGGTMTNIFMWIDGLLATPRLDRCGVAGVTRDRVLEAAARLSLPCAHRDFAWGDLLRAQELFLVNSLAGVWPVRSIEGEARAPGPVTRALQDVLAQEDDAQVA